MQTKDLAAEDVEGQAEQVMKNLGAVLDASGSSFAGVVKTTVLLEDMGDFGAVNTIYSKCSRQCLYTCPTQRENREPVQKIDTINELELFSHPKSTSCPSHQDMQTAGRYFPDQQPARACYAVKQLPLGAKVEIEAIALPN